MTGRSCGGSQDRPALTSHERAAAHSITSSARASSVAGTSRPSAFAVLRLCECLALILVAALTVPYGNEPAVPTALPWVYTRCRRAVSEFLTHASRDVCGFRASSYRRHSHRQHSECKNQAKGGICFEPSIEFALIFRRRALILPRGAFRHDTPPL